LGIRITHNFVNPNIKRIYLPSNGCEHTVKIPFLSLGETRLPPLFLSDGRRSSFCFAAAAPNQRRRPEGERKGGREVTAGGCRDVEVELVRQVVTVRGGETDRRRETASLAPCDEKTPSGSANRENGCFW
jgi:hypothetical protein